MCEPIISMATAVATLPIGARVPVCILALATQIETQAFVVEATDLVAALERLRDECRLLMDTYTEIETSIVKTSKAADRVLEEIRPTLCGRGGSGLRDETENEQ